MEKNIIKQYFRSGSRPTQEQFYALIDACYNENYSVFVSGYELKTGAGEHSPAKSINHEAGKTLLVPWFKRINIPNSRTFHYAIPACNLGPGMRIQKIRMGILLPESKTYEVKDKNNMVKVKQVISLNNIVFYNGTEPFFTLEGSKVPKDPNIEFIIDKAQDQWEGISVDISVDYDIKSNIAVSDQFDITERNAKELLHEFSGLGIEFNTDGS